MTTNDPTATATSPPNVIRLPAARLWPDPGELDGCTNHQREQYALSTAGPVGILGGTPGTGKTYTAAAILRALVRRVAPWDIRVVAPTGKAAVRLTAGLQANGVDSIEGTTIHRALGVSRNGHDGKGWGFQYNAQNPLPQRFVIVDECSMIDTELFASLTAALAPGSQLLLIGDTGQLPPVGHGAPLRDLIAAGLPYGCLSEIKRNAGAIVSACQSIRAGRPWQFSQRAELATGQNLTFHEYSTPEQVVGKIENLLRVAPSRGIDPVWDCQVLTPLNQGPVLGREAMNQRLRELLNPLPPTATPAERAAPFRVGDKVICLSNHHAQRLRDDAADAENAKAAEDPEKNRVEYVANGELGRVVAVTPKEVTIRLQTPDRTVIAQVFAAKPDTGTSPPPVTGADGRQAKQRERKSDGGSEFGLAYAITVHKSQGSSAPIVIVVADPSPGARMIGCRELVYTAISRAEKLCIVVGSRRALESDCRKIALPRRQTALAKMLAGALARNAARLSQGGGRGWGEAAASPSAEATTDAQTTATTATTTNATN